MPASRAAPLLGAFWFLAAGATLLPVLDVATGSVNPGAWVSVAVLVASGFTVLAGAGAGTVRRTVVAPAGVSAAAFLGLRGRQLLLEAMARGDTFAESHHWYLPTIHGLLVILCLGSHTCPPEGRRRLLRRAFRHLLARLRRPLDDGRPGRVRRPRTRRPSAPTTSRARGALHPYRDRRARGVGRRDPQDAAEWWRLHFPGAEAPEDLADKLDRATGPGRPPFVLAREGKGGCGSRSEIRSWWRSGVEGRART